VAPTDPLDLRAIDGDAVKTLHHSRQAILNIVTQLAFTTSFAGFGRRARRSACHCAVVARYANPPLRVAALRRSSLEIVDGDRPSWRAMSRTPAPQARRIAISSRSANDRYRPDAGASVTDGIPPPSRNHRTPTAADTQACTAASSLDTPRAIAAQNR